LQNSKPKNIMHIFLVLVIQYQFDWKIGDGLGGNNIEEKNTLIITNFTSRKGD